MPQTAETQTRTCTHCKQQLPDSAFSKKEHNQAACKSCLYDRQLGWKRANKDKVRGQRKRAEQKRKELQAIHRATRRAIDNGVLCRQACEVCGETQVDAHHDDYAKPLDVRWLCRRHHIELHGKKFHPGNH